jgi:hypothetical protein
MKFWVEEHQRRRRWSQLKEVTSPMILSVRLVGPRLALTTHSFAHVPAPNSPIASLQYCLSTRNDQATSPLTSHGGDPTQCHINCQSWTVRFGYLNPVSRMRYPLYYTVKVEIVQGPKIRPSLSKRSRLQGGLRALYVVSPWEYPPKPSIHRTSRSSSHSSPSTMGTD